jgi:hypothetical protein
MGKGILFVDRYGGSITVNGDPKGERELLEMVSGLHQYMICERIQQNQFLSDIYPHTVNSLRVITCLDSNTGEVFIPFAIQRFGTDISAPTDNFSQRGVSAPLDIDSGRMGTVVMKGPNWERLTLSSHPDSGREITGTLLPNWPQVRDEMIRKLEQHPFFDYVGWDVVITQDGFSVIEGNHNQGNYLPHAHYSLLSDQRLRNFFMAKGVIRTTQ